MKAVHIPTNEEISQERRRRYLETWPEEKQLEAMTEAAAGRPEKQKQMLADFAAIRAGLPYLS